MEFSSLYEKVIKCSKCGFCQPTCPTYNATGLEQEVARGRNQIVRGIIEGDLEFTRDVKAALFNCLLCDACYTNCFPKIKTDQIITQARYEYIKRFGQPQLQKYIFKTLLRSPESMTRLVKLVSFGKKTGLSGLVQVLRILGWFGRNLANAESLMASIPGTFLREKIADRSFRPEKRRAKLAYFVGCGINYAHPDVGLATLEVFYSRGFEIEILPNVCCGLPAYAYGDIESAKWFAEQNLRLMANSDADYIMTDCASCTSFLKEYEWLFADQPERAEEVKKIVARTKDATTILWESEEFARYNADTTRKVTFHEPCHLAHYLGEKTAPQAVLNNLPNAEFVELPESDYCCGGAGSYNIAHYELSMKILDRKMKNVESTGADILVTACPACMIQLDYGVRRQGLPTKVKHITQLLQKQSEKTRE